LLFCCSYSYDMILFAPSPHGEFLVKGVIDITLITRC
jgi:hypothetical protein